MKDDSFVAVISGYVSLPFTLRLYGVIFCVNYQKIYDNLIQKAKTRNLEGYFENHHILPKCLGGNNQSQNLVKLTPEEHFLAHLLLLKIYKNHPSLVCAANMMAVSTKHQKRNNNKRYGWLKRRLSECKRGANHPFFGKKHSEETKKRMSKSQRGENNTCAKRVGQFKNNKLIKEFSHAKLAAETLGLDPSNLTKACRGVIKTCGGFQWKYL